ncbi:MAG: hypothetical protein SOV73_07270, partial [Candidatus Faecivivens sp.]|nr:hypothetical protein [Candidatus Faecivivens sp.]
MKKLSDSEAKRFGSSLFKGLWVSRGQSPWFAQEIDIHSFSQFPERFNFNSRRQATQNIVQKEKVFNVGSAFRGALSLAERPSLAEQSPGLFRNSLPAERTASSASRKCVSL